MKLDYIPVSETEADLDESAFVEKHWTSIWEDKDIEGAVNAVVEGRDEYKIMDPYLRKLPRGSRLLDGGCGLGEYTVYYGMRGFGVTGLDLSRATVTRLKEKFPDYTFVVGDIRNTGFDTGIFDAYFSWGTFEHFEEGMTDCFQEARRILKPGGLLFVSVPYYNRRHQRHDRRCPPGPVDKTKLRFYQRRLTKNELQSEFESNGFDVLQTEPLSYWQGLRRMIVHDLRIPASSIIRKPVQLALSLVVPKDYAAHMIMGIGKRRSDESSSPG